MYKTDGQRIVTRLEEVLECHLFHDVLGGTVSTGAKVQEAGSRSTVLATI
jgi:hypothetical protein